MYGRRLVVYKRQSILNPISIELSIQSTNFSYSDCKQAPFRCLHAQALPPRRPGEWSHPFCGHVDVCLSLQPTSEPGVTHMLGDSFGIPPPYHKLLLPRGVSAFASSVQRFERVVGEIGLLRHRMRKCYSLNRLPSETFKSQLYTSILCWSTHTRFVPLCKAQIDWSTVNRSPNL